MSRWFQSSYRTEKHESNTQAMLRPQQLKFSGTIQQHIYYGGYFAVQISTGHHDAYNEEIAGQLMSSDG